MTCLSTYLLTQILCKVTILKNTIYCDMSFNLPPTQLLCEDTILKIAIYYDMSINLPPYSNFMLSYDFKKYNLL